jgi:hypothetical protein
MGTLEDCTVMPSHPDGCLCQACWRARGGRPTPAPPAAVSPEVAAALRGAVVELRDAATQLPIAFVTVMPRDGIDGFEINGKPYTVKAKLLAMEADDNAKATNVRLVVVVERVEFTELRVVPDAKG